MGADQNFNKSQKSPSEMFCKNKFDEFLKSQLPNSVISWDSVEQDPPDYFLFIDGTKYAVEITIIVEKVDIGTKNPLPIGKIHDELNKFIQDEVESVARHNDYLHGLYLVTFWKPIHSFAKIETIIQKKLLSHIRATQSLTTSPAERIYECDREICKITKIHDGENAVLIAGPGDSKFKHEILVNARHLLNERIENKKHRLRNVSSPKVLLLHNKDILCAADTYKACISSIPSRVSFHSVFIVDRSGPVLLYSQDPRWVSGIRHTT